jgi:hypothetical protein
MAVLLNGDGGVKWMLCKDEQTSMDLLRNVKGYEANHGSEDKRRVKRSTCV